MPKAKGPKCSQLNADNVENRAYKVIGWRPQMGRSTARMLCPFCDGELIAYLWSLPNGKRCQCGAILFGRGLAYHFKDRKAA